MAENPLPKDKRELLGRIRREWGLLERTVSDLSEAELGKTGADGWSIKDHLVHLTVWQRWLLEHHLGGKPAHEVMEIDPESADDFEVDQINEILWQRYHDRDAATVWADLRAAYDQVLIVLGKLPFEEMMLPRYADQPEKGPVLRWIVADTYEHYEEHLPGILKLLGRGE